MTLARIDARATEKGNLLPTRALTHLWGHDAAGAGGKMQTSELATAEQGALADTAVQRGEDKITDFQLQFGANFTAASDLQTLLSTATATDYWHFGGMVFDPSTGRMHWFYRSAVDHFLRQSQIVHFFSDDMGATIYSFGSGGSIIAGPSVLSTSPAGWDYRDIACGIAPDGTILLAWSSVPLGGGAVTSLRFARSIDGGRTFVGQTTLKELPGVTGRIRGRIKVIPGIGKSRVMITAWEQTGATVDVNDVLAFYSDDMGLTWAAGAPIFTGGAENEVEVAFWNNLGVAVARKNTGGMSCAITTDFGATWTKVSDIADSVTGDVAPSVDIMRDAYGTVWVLIGACSRATDSMRWWWATLKDVLASGGAAFTTYDDVASDMQAFSGYHCPQVLPSGEMAVFEVKEDNVGGRVLRVRRMLPEPLFSSPRPWTPTLSFDVPGDLAVTYTRNLGLYSQEGKKVTVYFDVSTSAFTYTTATGKLLLRGLPKPSNNMLNTQIVGGGGLEYAGITRTGMGSVTPRLQQNTDFFNFRSSGSGLVAADVSTTNIASGSAIRLLGTFVYYTDG